MTSRQNDWHYECVQKHQICIVSLLCNSECLGRWGNWRIFVPKPYYTLALCWCLEYASRRMQLSYHPAELKRRTCWVLQAPIKIKALLYLNITRVSFRINGLKCLCTQGRRLKTVLFTTVVINWQNLSTCKTECNVNFYDQIISKNSLKIFKENIF